MIFLELWYKFWNYWRYWNSSIQCSSWEPKICRTRFFILQLLLYYKGSDHNKVKMSLNLNQAAILGYFPEMPEDLTIKFKFDRSPFDEIYKCAVIDYTF